MKRDLDPTEKLFTCVTLLEETNHQLVAMLKKCHTLLQQFTNDVPDPAGWKAMLKNLKGAIRAGEKAAGKKAVH